MVQSSFPVFGPLSSRRLRSGQISLAGLVFVVAVSSFVTGPVYAQTPDQGPIAALPGVHLGVFSASVAQVQATMILQASPADSRQVRAIRALEAERDAIRIERDAARSEGEAALAQAEARFAAISATYASQANQLFSELRLAQSELDRYKADLSTVLAAATPEELVLRQRLADGDFSQTDRMSDLRRTRQAAQRASIAADQAAEIRVEAQAYAAGLARGAPGTTLAGLLALWDEAAGLVPGDFATQVERARLSRILGNLDGARAAARAAIDAARNDHEQIVGRYEAMRIAQRMGQLDQARSHGQTALNLARGRVRANGDDPQALDDLQNSLIRNGELAVAEDRTAEAAQLFDNAVDVARRLVAMDGADVGFQRRLAWALTYAGDIKVRRGDSEAAERAYGESLDIRTRLVRQMPDDIESRRDRMVSLERIGGLRLAAGDYEGARVLADEKLAIARALARLDPTNGQARRDLALSLSQSADAAMRAPGFELRAEPSLARQLNEALQLSLDLLLADPSSAVFRADCLAIIDQLIILPGQPTPASERSDYERWYGRLSQRMTQIEATVGSGRDTRFRRAAADLRLALLAQVTGGPSPNTRVAQPFIELARRLHADASATDRLGRDISRLLVTTSWQAARLATAANGTTATAAEPSLAQTVLDVSGALARVENTPQNRAYRHLAIRTARLLDPTLSPEARSSRALALGRELTQIEAGFGDNPMAAIDALLAADQGVAVGGWQFRQSMTRG